MIRLLFSLIIWVYYGGMFILMFPFVLLAYIITAPFDKYKRVPNWILLMGGKLYVSTIPTWNVHYHGIDNYEKTEGTIIISNHQSFMDMPTQSLLPWTFKWVSKKSLFFVPFMGWTMKLSGHISIDRNKKTAIKALNNIIPLLDHKIPIILFPEGTRSLDGKLHKFKNGAFSIATKHNYKIQPIVMDGTRNLLPSGDWKFSFHQDIDISILKPIDPQNFDSISDLKKHAYKVMKNELKRLRGETQKTETADIASIN